jgi:hypothetical protein
MVRSARRFAGTVVITAAVAVAGCSGNDDSADPTSPTQASATTTSRTTSNATTAPTSDDAVVAAIGAFWDMYLDVGGRSGPFDPTATRDAIAAHATGDELEQLYNAFQVNSIRGQVIRGEIENSPEVIENDGATAEVRDCYDDRTGLYRVSDGARLDQDDPARKRAMLTLVFESGVWKVASIRDEGTGCSE